MLLRFLQTLHDSGRAELDYEENDLETNVRRAGTDPSDVRKILQCLQSWHAVAAMDLPGPPLAFHPDAALWGAIHLFRAACLASFREMGETAIDGLLRSDPMPDDTDPAAHFSADLCLRHWPDLYRMARARSEDDPLVRVMHAMAAEFPVSSLGMNRIDAARHPALQHVGLRQYFAERALERADHACLADPETTTFIRLNLGAYAAILGRGLLSSPNES